LIATIKQSGLDANSFAMLGISFVNHGHRTNLNRQEQQHRCCQFVRSIALKRVSPEFAELLAVLAINQSLGCVVKHMKGKLVAELLMRQD
jgi:hypothetical protein